jgi:hypothetical protein
MRSRDVREEFHVCDVSSLHRSQICMRDSFPMDLPERGVGLDALGGHA